MRSIPGIFVDQTTEEEGYVIFPYDDATGKILKTGDTIKGNISIGVGHNLSANGLSRNVISILSTEDYTTAMSLLDVSCPWTDTLDQVRYFALVDMVFNMGIKKFEGFNTFLALMETEQYDRAGDDLETTLWAKEEPARSKHLISQIRTGEWWLRKQQK